jgi:hypothetical protein
LPFTPIYDKKMLMSELKQKLHEIAPMIFRETPVLFAYFDFLPVIQQYQDAYRERALSGQFNDKER